MAVESRLFIMFRNEKNPLSTGLNQKFFRGNFFHVTKLFTFASNVALEARMNQAKVTKVVISYLRVKNSSAK